MKKKGDGIIKNSGNIISGSQFGPSVNIIGTAYGDVHQERFNGSTSQNEVILQDLRNLQQKLAETDSGIARMVGELKDAVEEQNQPKITTMIKDLTTGVIGSVIAELASSTLKKFLGLS